MRRLLLIAGLLAAAAAIPVWAQQQGDPTFAKGFDHQAHDKAYAAAKQAGKQHASGPAPDCASCHLDKNKQFKKMGSDKHSPCQDCHEPAEGWHRRNESEADYAKRFAKLCQVCHTVQAFEDYGKKRTKTVAVYWEATGKFTARDHGTAFSHSTHMGKPLGLDAKLCQRCHTFGQKTKLGGHDVCGDNCHKTQANPPLGACAACHLEPGRGDFPARRQWNKYRTFFSRPHEKHAPATVADCKTCHGNLEKTDRLPPELPGPSMAMCADSCHDGKRSFNAVGTTCTRCHLKPPAKGGNP